MPGLSIVHAEAESEKALGFHRVHSETSLLQALARDALIEPLDALWILMVDEWPARVEAVDSCVTVDDRANGGGKEFRFAHICRLRCAGVAHKP